MVCPATGAVPVSNLQRQLIHDVTTMPTPLRTRKPSVNLDKATTIPVALIFELSDQLRPCSIADGLSQLPILDHILHSQIINGDGLVFTHQSSRQLVKKIISRIANLCIDSSDFNDPSFVSVVRPFLLTTQRFLRSTQFAAFSGKAFRVGNLPKKLLNAFWRWRNPCCRGTQLTSLRNCRSSTFFHAVSMAEFRYTQLVLDARTKPLS